jgi:hypothetical protein
MDCSNTSILWDINTIGFINTWLEIRLCVFDRNLDRFEISSRVSMLCNITKWNLDLIKICQYFCGSPKAYIKTYRSPAFFPDQFSVSSSCSLKLRNGGCIELERVLQKIQRLDCGQKKVSPNTKLLLTSIASFPSPQERDCGIGQRKVSMMAEVGSVKKAAATTADRLVSFISEMN